VTVTWSGVDGILGTADDVVFDRTTDASGGYLVSNLPFGPCSVGVDTTSPKFPAGLTQTYDSDGLGTTSTSAVTLTGGATVPGASGSPVAVVVGGVVGVGGAPVGGGGPGAGTGGAGVGMGGDAEPGWSGTDVGVLAPGKLVLTGSEVGFVRTRSAASWATSRRTHSNGRSRSAGVGAVLDGPTGSLGPCSPFGTVISDISSQASLTRCVWNWPQ